MVMVIIVGGLFAKFCQRKTIGDSDLPRAIEQIDLADTFTLAQGLDFRKLVAHAAL